MLHIMIYLVGLGAILSLIFAYYNFRKGTEMAHGTPTMQDIAKSIREGAIAFLKRQFSISIPIIIGIGVLFGVVFTPWAGIAFLIGAAMSSFAGLVGMRAAVIYNERVVNEARLGIERNDPSALGRALNVAFRG
ncbi:MAG: sodium-translocating pyrophosphatase, partial [Clostridiales bacterium]|nr:sodium-translocating pyrophosphatase [Clostridiales bacterium]